MNTPKSEELERYFHRNHKLNIRSYIYKNVSDLDSLVGTVSDAAQVLVLLSCADAVALAGAADFGAYKQSRMDALTALSGSEDAAADIVQQAGKLLADVQSGAVLMPFLFKPDRVTGVFRDVAERATGVAQALVKPETVSE